VVRNENSGVSRSIAEAYMRKRRVRNLVSVRCPDSAVSPDNETIPYPDYLKEIETPLRAFLAFHQEIDFIVLTKGVPIRIERAPGIGLNNSRPSLDSYLAALDYDKIPSASRVWVGGSGTAWANRFWNAELPFSHASFGGYLVTRLDGFTEADVSALILRALIADRIPPTGKTLLDTDPAYGFAFNYDMERAAEVLQARGIPVELDVSPTFVGARGHLMG